MFAQHTDTSVRTPPPFIEVTEEVLAAMVQTIVDAVNPESIILFGSQAHAIDSKRANSDVDLLIIEREPFGKNRPRGKELSKIRRALRRFFIPKDILVYSHDDVAKLKSFPGHVIHDCFREGKVLYERAQPSPHAPR
mgnify:CR=1 FL=1